MSERRTLNPKRKAPPLRPWPKWLPALAVGVLALGLGFYLFGGHKQAAPPPAETPQTAAAPLTANAPASLVEAQSPQAAFDDAKAGNTVAAWDAFLAKADSGQVQTGGQAGGLAAQARLERAKLIAAQNTLPAFNEAMNANTLSGWDDFLSRVDSGELQRGPVADQARKERAKLVTLENTKAAFNQAKRTNTIEGWDEFLANIDAGEYQAEPYGDQARREKAKLAGGLNPQPEFDEAKRTNTIEGWDNFLGKVRSGELQGGALSDRARRERSLLIISQLQSELKRVGCDPGPATTDWRDGSRRALDAYNTNAGTSFETNIASIEALKSVQSQSGRVCPLVCDHGLKAEGDKCVAIECNPDDADCTVPEAKPDAKADTKTDTKSDVMKTDEDKPQTEAQPDQHHQARHRERQPRRAASSHGRPKGKGGCMLFGQPRAC